jgi:hypothetical protein
MTWDPSVSNSHMQVSNSGFTVSSVNPVYFSSARSSYPLLPGYIYFFEVALAMRRGKKVKIGVTQEQDLENKLGFSGTEKGWSFYGTNGGQKRHNANSGNCPYGHPLGSKATIGLLVDMREGRLGFVIDGKWCGFAFIQPEFVCTQPVYAAFSQFTSGSSCSFIKKKSSWNLIRFLLFCRKYIISLRRLPEVLIREVGLFLISQDCSLPSTVLIALQN